MVFVRRLGALLLLLAGIGMVLSAWTHSLSSISETTTLQFPSREMPLLPPLDESYIPQTDRLKRGHWWQTNINAYNPLDPLLWNAKGQWTTHEKAEALYWSHWVEHYRRTMAEVVEKQVLPAKQSGNPLWKTRWKALEELLRLEWEQQNDLYWSTSIASLFSPAIQHQQLVQKTHEDHTASITRQYGLSE